jgi:ATP-dependent Clp protease ATP-binding subunit ClpA
MRGRMPLPSWARDLTAEAGAQKPFHLVGREKELEELFRAIELGARHLLLIGPVGIGKNALLLALASRMQRRDVPEVLRDKRLLCLARPDEEESVPISWHEKLAELLEHARKSHGVVIALPDIQDSCRSECLPQLKELLRQHRVILIATTTPRGYHDQIEPSLVGHEFRPLFLHEPPVDEAIEILRQKSFLLEETRGIVFAPDAIEACVVLSDRYYFEGFLPGKAIELARDVVEYAKQKPQGRQVVTREDVAHVLGKILRIDL